MMLLKIEGLTKFYGDFKALDNLNMNVEANQIYGFIGRNGAGKTTTLHLIMRFLSHEAGSIQFNGEPVENGDVAFKKDIAFVPDVPAFPDYLTGEAVLRLTADFIGLKADVATAEIRKVIKRVGIEYPRKKVGSYSRGMKQRLSLGCALLKKPKLLLMDEPTSALDPVGRKDLLQLIKTLKNETTVLYSTHILNDAQQVCDTIGLIEAGKLLLEGRVSDILSPRESSIYVIESSRLSALKTVLDNSKLIDSVDISRTQLEIHLHENAKQTDFFDLLSKAAVEIESVKRKSQSLEEVFVEVLKHA